MHFTFIIANNHLSSTSLVYNCGQLLRNDIQSSLSASEISHSVYLYLHIFIWILFFHNSQTGMMNVWPRCLAGRGDATPHPQNSTRPPSELIGGQASSSERGTFVRVAPLHSSSTTINIFRAIFFILLKYLYGNNAVKGVGVNV